MRNLLLLVTLMPGLAAAQVNPIPESNMPVVTQDKPDCIRSGARRIGDVPPPGARKLGEMPPAKPIYTVVREIDGCPIPVSVGAR